jgi:hypothetical protein
LERHLETLFSVSQGHFHPPAIADVGGGTEHAVRPAIVSSQHVCAYEQPTSLTVVLTNPQDDFGKLPDVGFVGRANPIETTPVMLDRKSPVVDMDEL